MAIITTLIRTRTSMVPGVITTRTDAKKMSGARSILDALVRRVDEPHPARGIHMKYFTFIRHAEHDPATIKIPPALMNAMSTFIERSQREGVLVDTGGFLPSKDGVLMRVARGKLTITDGPFTEAKEVIGGWAILQGSREVVMRAATEFVELHRVHWPEFEFECEVRPMFEPGQGPG
jgi:hypothetical protein